MNNKHMQAKRLSTPSASHGADIVWRGYDDRRNGRPFRAEYDGFSLLDQRRYELGRMYATAAIVADGAAPRWARNRLLRLTPSAAAIARTERDFMRGGAHA